MKTCLRPSSPTSLAVAAARSLAFGSAAARPRQAKFGRTRRQWQGHVQKLPYLGNAHLGQHGVLGSPLPPPGGSKQPQTDRLTRRRSSRIYHAWSTGTPNVAADGRWVSSGRPARSKPMTMRGPPQNTDWFVGSLRLSLTSLPCGAILRSGLEHGQGGAR